MKTVTDNLALFSVIALALGLYRLLVYYGVFGIDIVSYIDITEILQAQFFALLGIVMVVAFSGLVLMVFLINEIKFSEPDSISKYLQKHDNFGLYKIGVIILGLLILLFAISGHISSNTARDKLIGKDLINVVLIMDDDSVKTNNTLIYVGKTKNYVFLYNRRILQSRIIKMDEIKEIKVQRVIKSRK